MTWPLPSPGVQEAMTALHSVNVALYVCPCGWESRTAGDIGATAHARHRMTCQATWL